MNWNHKLNRIANITNIVFYIKVKKRMHSMRHYIGALYYYFENNDINEKNIIFAALKNKSET